MRRRAVPRGLAVLVLVLVVASCGETPDLSPTSTFISTSEPTQTPVRQAEGRSPEPTAEPTSAPTEKPTPSPARPTPFLPTRKPTTKPTAKPTRPTAAMPTRKPTLAPTGPTSPPDRDRILLQFRLEEGESYSQRVTIAQVISQTMFGVDTVMTQTMGFAYTFLVEDVDSKGYMMIRVTYDEILMRLETGYGGFEYDSTDPGQEVPPGAEGFAALVGKGFYLHMAPNGEILGVDGVDEFIEAILDDLELPEGPERDAIEEQIKSQFGDEALQEQMTNSLMQYPDEPIAVGDSWTKETELASTMPLLLEATWTLRYRQGGISILDFVAAAQSLPDAPPVEQDSFKIYYDLSGEQEGFVEIDEATGWTLRGEVEQYLYGEIRTEDESNPDTDMSWPISMRSTTTIESYD